MRSVITVPKMAQVSPGAGMTKSGGGGAVETTGKRDRRGHLQLGHQHVRLAEGFP